MTSEPKSEPWRKPTKRYTLLKLRCTRCGRDSRDGEYVGKWRVNDSELICTDCYARAAENR